MKKQFQLVTLALSILALGLATPSHAQSREKHRFGLGMGILSDPAPSLVAYQAKFNLTKWLQIFAGYGSIKATAVSLDTTTSSTGSGAVTTYGAGGKVFLLSGWNFSPYVGGGYSMVKSNGTFSLNGKAISSASSNFSVIYGSVGLDHQANIGFNIGAGVQYFFSPTDLKDVIKYLPHVYFGWFF